jgi:two-component system cell cycle response regulator
MKKGFDTQLFSQALAACTDGMVIADATAPDMPLVYVNAAFERLTGYSAREVLGSNCRFLQRGDTDQVGLALVRASLENGEPCVVTVRNYRKDGSPFWNELSLSPISDPAGTVTHFFGTLTDVSERVTAEQKLLAKHKQLLARKRELENLALRDGLTGLYNRRAFDEQLEREWNRARRDQTPLSLIMIDIDHFKHYNDTFGHPAGDHCIQVVASAVQRCFARGSDLVARYGGDEFVVLASALDHKQAQRRAEQLQQTIKTLGFASSAYAAAPPISLSIGVATATSLQRGTPEHLLHAADRALYQAKRRQHDRFEEPAPTYTSRARSRGPAHPALSTSA